MKAASFHPAALQVIRGFPPGARLSLGEAILKLQHGALLGMPLSRPMPAVAPGVSELRVKDRGGAYRAFYFTRKADCVWIIHAFEKKTQATPHRQIAIARRRLREMTHDED